LEILVAEDNVLNQKVVLKLLDKAGGYKADIANNGKEAISLLEKKNYDLLFMDVQVNFIFRY
jgi:two-component system sensor histidine kinase/response regulator